MSLPFDVGGLFYIFLVFKFFPRFFGVSLFLVVLPPSLSSIQHSLEFYPLVGHFTTFAAPPDFDRGLAPDPVLLDLFGLKNRGTAAKVLMASERT